MSWRIILLSIAVTNSACAPASPAPTSRPTPTEEKIAYAAPSETRAPGQIRVTPSATITRGNTAKILTPTRTATRISTPRQNFPQDISSTTPTRANSLTNSHTLTPTHTLTRPPTSPPASGEAYGTLAVFSAPTNPPAAIHPDLNLALRGYAPTNAQLALVDYTGEVGSGAPQLYGLFSDQRVPNFKSAFQVREWDWANQRAGGLISDWDATILGLATTPGESIRVPDSGAEIGNGYRAFVLYADAARLTLKYTREDNVVAGYTLHLENILVDANLLARYEQTNAAGRGELPALRAGQAIGKASGDQILVGVRDAGSFLDPRSRKDWWRGR